MSISLTAASLRQALQVAGLASDVRAAKPLRALRAARKKVADCATAGAELEQNEKAFATRWRQAAGLADALLASWQTAEQTRAELGAKLVELLELRDVLSSCRTAFTDSKNPAAYKAAAEHWEQNAEELRRRLGLPRPPDHTFEVRYTEIIDAIDVLDRLFVEAVRAKTWRRFHPTVPAWLSDAAAGGRMRGRLRRLVVAPESMRVKAWRELTNTLNHDGLDELVDLEEQNAFLRVGIALAERLPSEPPAPPAQKRTRQRR